MEVIEFACSFSAAGALASRLGREQLIAVAEMWNLLHVDARAAIPLLKFLASHKRLLARAAVRPIREFFALGQQK
jgi:hypothetical protein